jgi:hypothetical protein
MSKNSWLPLLFSFVGCVEFVIGGLFIFLPDQLFNYFALGLRPDTQYLQLPAVLIMVFGWMMFNVAKEPQKNLNLILYINLFKAGFISVVIYNWLTKGLPWLWLSFVGFDLVYLAGFLAAYRIIKENR